MIEIPFVNRMGPDGAARLRHTLDRLAAAIRPCRDPCEHAVNVHYTLDYSLPGVWEAYGLESKAAFAGTLVVLEKEGSLDVPLEPRTFPRRRACGSSVYKTEAWYNQVVGNNLRVVDALVAMLTATAGSAPPPFVIVKVGLRHHRRLFVDNAGHPVFKGGHANMVVLSTGTRHVFHMDPLRHKYNRPVAELVLQWWGSIVAPRLVTTRMGSQPRRQTWTFASNTAVAPVFPQADTALCRMWAWLLACTLTVNNVTSVTGFDRAMRAVHACRSTALGAFLWFHADTVCAREPCHACCHALNRVGTASRDAMFRVDGDAVKRPAHRCTTPTSAIRVGKTPFKGVFKAYKVGGS